MEKIKSRLYLTVFFFTILSVAFALLSNGRQKDFYYISIYASFIGLIIERHDVSFRKFNIAYPVILFGIIKISWFFIFQHEPGGYNFYNDQFNGGKKLVLGGILIFYLNQFSYYLRPLNYKKIILYILAVGFISATCFAVWQSLQGMERVMMGINRASISAYIYSTLSIVLVFLLYTQKNKLHYAMAAIVIIASFIILILTGTRAAIICHLLIMSCMTFYYFKKLHFKSLLIVCVLTAIAFGVLYDRYILPKINQTYNEVTLYQDGKDNTSLGARFSMWTVGLENFYHAPFGQSLKSRAEYSSSYVATRPQYKTTIHYIYIHLHNEMIDTLSLQGLAGGLALLWLYISLAWNALKKRNLPLLFTMNCVIVYGLTDVLFISSEAILFYMSLIGISGVMHNEKKPAR